MVDRELVLRDERPHRGVVVAQQRHDLLGLGALGKPGTAAQVAEHDDELAAMAFEDALVALGDNQFGQLRREKPAQFAGALDLGELRRDPRLKLAVPPGDLLGALAQFGQEAGVLHRDDRLDREVLKPGDLFFGKGSNLFAASCYNAEQSIIFAQRDEQRCSNAGELGDALRSGIVNLSNVGDVHEALAGEQWQHRMVGGRAESLPCPFRERSEIAVNGYGAERLAVIGLQRSVGNATQAVRFLKDHIKHRGEVARRRIDDLQNLCSRRLLLQGLVALGGPLFKLLGALVELPSEFGNSHLAVGCRLIERRGHLLIRLAVVPAPPDVSLLSPPVADSSP
jgi:hypothetical protein